MRLGLPTETSSNITITDITAFEISCYPLNVYKTNFGTENIITKNIEHIKPETLPEAQLWTMSPPCQPFTRTAHAKHLDIEDKRCKALLHIVRMLDVLGSEGKGPKWIFLENVKYFHGSQMYEVFVACLKRNGYSYKIYTVSPNQIGYPNMRLRLYMLCEKSDRFVEDMEKVYLSLEDEEDVEVKDVGAFVEDLNADDLEGLVIPEDILGKDYAVDLSYVNALDNITYCFTKGYSRRLHQSTGSVFYMEGDRPLAEGGLDRDNLQQYYGKIRRFHPKEVANIMGFPRWFKFPDDMSYKHQWGCIGNSVNVDVVKVLLRELLCR